MLIVKESKEHPERITDKLRVLLINPPTPGNEVWIREGRCEDVDRWDTSFPPLTLAYIANVLDEEAETLLLDCGVQKFDLETVLQKIDDFDPSLIIFTTATPTIQPDMEWFLPSVKKRFPDISMAATGIHVTALTSEVMEQYPVLDFIISSEPEITSLELVKALKQDSQYSNILGLAYQDNGKAKINSPRPFVEEIDSLGIPAWDKVDFSKYIMPIKNRPFSLINFSRGCPYQCSFCTVHTYYGSKLRTRSPKQIIQEIELLMSRGVRDFLFWTEFFTADEDHMNEFLDLIFEKKLHKKIQWVTNVRTDYAKVEHLKKMKKAGCWQIVFGLEFGTDEMLNKVNKGGWTSVEASKKAVHAAAKAGLAVAGHFIIGYPGEKISQAEKTITFAASLPLTFAHFYAATPFPGSDLYEEAVKNKLFDTNNWGSVTLEAASLNSDEFDTIKTKQLIDKAYKKFYSRPSVWYRIMNVPGSFNEYCALFSTGVKFLSKKMFA